MFLDQRVELLIRVLEIGVLPKPLETMWTSLEIGDNGVDLLIPGLLRLHQFHLEVLVPQALERQYHFLKRLPENDESGNERSRPCQVPCRVRYEGQPVHGSSLNITWGKMGDVGVKANCLFHAATSVISSGLAIRFTGVPGYPNFHTVHQGPDLWAIRWNVSLCKLLLPSNDFCK